MNSGIITGINVDSMTLLLSIYTILISWLHENKAKVQAIIHVYKPSYFIDCDI